MESAVKELLSKRFDKYIEDKISQIISEGIIYANGMDCLFKSKKHDIPVMVQLKWICDLKFEIEDVVSIDNVILDDATKSEIINEYKELGILEEDDSLLADLGKKMQCIKDRIDPEENIDPYVFEQAVFIVPIEHATNSLCSCRTCSSKMSHS